MAAAWTVIAKVEEEKRGATIVPGMRVVITNGDIEHETARVAFDREKSKNPAQEFGTVLRAELDKAEEAALVMNDLDDEFDRAEAEAIERARERMREVLGKPPAWNAKPL
jgi:protoporphyrinogen oxidase